MTKASRQPIVVVLGHVDHGKTSLLDAIRKTNVASREAGGITQGIGASVISRKDGKKITFIDTPGHAAFSNMRSRGAKVADIAVLVVAADDGVKPQTKEAIEAIRAASIPFIVAITKVDLSTANVEVALRSIENEGVYFEKRGGDIPYLEVSSKTGQGLDELLDLVTLLSEVNDISGDREGKLEAVVIESFKDQRGVTVSVVVRDGTLKVGQQIATHEFGAKVRGLFNDLGATVKAIYPGEPAQILGFDAPPPVGSTLGEGTPEEVKATGPKKPPSYAIDNRPRIVAKAKKAGALEALVASIPKGIFIVAASVGEVTESDVLYAKSSGANIYAYESKSAGSVNKLADAEGVKIKSFAIIYALVEDLENLIKGELEIITGKAEIIGIFPFDNKKVAGCKVKEGKITRNDKLRLMRGNSKIADLKIISLKKGKTDMMEASAGDDCGIIFVPQLDFAIGDMLVSVKSG